MHEEIHRRRTPGSQFLLAVNFDCPDPCPRRRVSPEVRAAATYLEKLWDFHQAPGCRSSSPGKGALFFPKGSALPISITWCPPRPRLSTTMGSISKTETVVAVMQLLENLGEIAELE